MAAVPFQRPESSALVPLRKETRFASFMQSRVIVLNGVGSVSTRPMHAQLGWRSEPVGGS